jgi:tetratricopeptide (TPR) repeat protein
MFKNPWFTLVIGLMVGLALGYVFAERQPIPPGKALRLGAQPAAQQAAGLPDGHPPVDANAAAPEAQFFEQQISEIQDLLAQSPNDPGLMASMGDAYFELARATTRNEHWADSAAWYEKAMEAGRDRDPNVLTDLAVVYRNLGQQDRSVDLLERAVAVDDQHWQAWFNLVIIRNFDLHDHDGAKQALSRLKTIAENNPEVPDLSRIEQEVMSK